MAWATRAAEDEEEAFVDAPFMPNRAGNFGQSDHQIGDEVSTISELESSEELSTTARVNSGHCTSVIEGQNGENGL